MAHFAEIDDNNTVLRVLVTDNNDPNGDEGYQWLVDTFGGTWTKTSYNTFKGEHLLGGTPFRKNYAAIGYTYDLVRDAFIPPKPYNSWVLNEDTCWWEAPTPYPTNDGSYKWVEEDLNWQLVEGV